jgi:hypothetical protein
MPDILIYLQAKPGQSQAEERLSNQQKPKS